MTTPKCLRKGFTLVEILAVIAVISVLASGAYYTASSVNAAARESKLDSDVSALNSAVQIYEAMGGDLSNLDGVPGATVEEKVLTKLKIKGDDETRAKQNGITGSLIDPRLTAGSYTTSGPRAVWNASKKVFEITNSGSGIREFVLSDAAAVAARSESPNADPYVRERVLDAANVKEGPAWVWDYTQASVPEPTPVDNPYPGVSTPTPTPNPPDEPPTPAPTSTPFSPAPPPKSRMRSRARTTKGSPARP